MTVSRSTRALIAVAVVAVVGAVVAIVAPPRGSEGPLVASPPGSTPTASPASPTPPPAELEVELRRVRGRGPNGVVKPRDLAGPAEGLRRTFSDLYETAFVDPDRWDGGRFSGLDAFFADDARADVRRDLDELTLGRLARSLDAVAPRRATVDVEFVTDRADHPAVAFADMEFRGTGRAGEVDVPIRQDGRFVLRRSHGRWRIDSYDVTSHVPTSASVEAKARDARFAPGPAGTGPLFVLVLGSDARPGQVVTGTRADSIHIVSVNPRLDRGAIVGIPRDSYVSIPGHGMSKINAALAFGGPELMVRTVEQLAHVRIDAYLLTGFDGFRRTVDAIGGVDVRVPYRMDDPASGAHFRPGRTHLNGREALSFSRDRHDVPGGDLGRSMNQGRVILGTLQRLRSEFAKDPARLASWLVAATRFVRTDLTLSEMTELLLASSTFEPGRIRSAVAWGSGGSANGQSIVRLGSRAFSLFRDISHDGVIGH